MVGKIQVGHPVRDQDHRCLAARREDRGEHITLGPGIERVGRLVQHQKFRAAQEGAGQPDALALPPEKRKPSGRI